MSQPFDFALVVDDDPDIALAARLALRELFARVETLTSPDDLATVLKKETKSRALERTVTQSISNLAMGEEFIPTQESKTVAKFLQYPLQQYHLQQSREVHKSRHTIQETISC